MIFVNASQNEKKQKNYCKEAINLHTSFRVTGVYGSPLESEWHPSSAYVLLKEMKRFLVLEKEFVKESDFWRFEFAEMIGGKTIVFVFKNKIYKRYCNGTNAFFVVRK